MYLREVFDVYAASWRDDRRTLGEEELREAIPGWVFDWAVTHGWLEYPLQRRIRYLTFLGDGPLPPSHEQIPEHECRALLGQRKVTEAYRIEFLNDMESRITHWLAEALMPPEVANDGQTYQRPEAEAVRELRRSPVMIANDEYFRVMARRAAELSPIPEHMLPKSAKSADPPVAPSLPETIGEQVERLREECRWTHEQVADAAGFDPTTVARHIGGAMIPSIRSLGKYERAFSKQLGRKIVIHKTPGKRR